MLRRFSHAAIRYKYYFFPPHSIRKYARAHAYDVFLLCFSFCCFFFLFFFFFTRRSACPGVRSRWPSVVIPQDYVVVDDRDHMSVLVYYNFIMIVLLLYVRTASSTGVLNLDWQIIYLLSIFFFSIYLSPLISTRVNTRVTLYAMSTSSRSIEFTIILYKVS